MVIATAVLGACAEGPQNPASPTTLRREAAPPAPGPIASAPAPEQPAAKFEQDFLIDMIDHHEIAIHMAEMCLQKAVHNELRAMCESIIATQTAEQELMQGWLQSWYGVSHTPDVKRGMMKHMERLESLSGAEFEVEFMEMMIRHHAGAIREGEKCVRKAYHRELIDLCHDIIAAQTAEIQQMEQWLCDWYSRCRGSAT